MNSTVMTSYFWLDISLIFCTALFGLWLAKTYLQKFLISKHQVQYYPHVLILFSLLLFFGVLISISTNNTFFSLNDQTLLLFKKNFNAEDKHLFEVITVFGKEPVILLTLGLTSLWFAYKRAWRTLFFWIINALIGIALIYIIKDLVAFPRPFATDAVDVDSIFSFPSGHVTRVTLLTTFFTLLVSTFLTHRQKVISFFCCGFVIELISLSRLFFEAHWFSDVIASIGLGLACALSTFTLYQRKPTHALPVKTLVIVFSISWLLSWAIFHLPSHLN